MDKQIELLTERLNEIKDIKGRLDEKFKNDVFEFDFSNFRKEKVKLGYEIKNYVVYQLDGNVFETQKDVKQKQNVVNEYSDIKQNVVKEEQVIGEQISLTKDEILFVKELFKNKQELVKPKQPLFLPNFSGTKKTTGISVYIELWERWGHFKKRYPMYSGTDLLALALEEFMEKYDESSDS